MTGIYQDSQHMEKIILGIDPGTNILGYSLLRGVKNTINISACGIVRFSGKEDHFVRINKIFNSIGELIHQYQPDTLAIESPFFGKNVQSMLKLGRAQGAAILAGMQHNLEVVEYSPSRIKQAITGNGNASKEQVANMLNSLYKIDLTSVHLDETDAIAVAVCHYFEGNRPAGSGKQFRNWKDFLENNPGRGVNPKQT